MSSRDSPRRYEYNTKLKAAIYNHILMTDTCTSIIFKSPENL